MRASISTTLAIIAFVCITACAVNATQYTPAAQADKITFLPGLAQQPSFNQFSGYLVVDEASQRSIHYWYVESQNNPTTDPLIWWSNGGPGCSGLLGFLTEHGPFRLADNGTDIEPYEYSWNKIANVLYVEVPAGVGFSFSNNPNDYNTNDTQTAADNYVAIQQFFIRFPHLTANTFYISAESYGGHYVPQLAQLLVEYGGVDNFAGFLVGNPLTDGVENAIGSVSTMCGHSLASKPTCDSYNAACLGPQGNPNSTSCAMSQSQVQSEAGNLDPYGLDYPVCNAGAQQNRALARHMGKVMKNGKMLGDNDFDNDLPYDPCGMSESAVYLNRADVKTALHISPNAFAWVGCSTNVNYDRSAWGTQQQPHYQYLLSSGKNLRMIVFSGDDDSICGTLGTQYWMFNLFGSQVTSPWTQWMYETESYGSQIGGSVVQFTGISFVTVHSAGHMVPTYQPERGLAVLKNFLAGTFTTTSVPADATSKTHHRAHHKKVTHKKHMKSQRRHA